jgi:hypothetical protein
VTESCDYLTWSSTFSASIAVSTPSMGFARCSGLARAPRPRRTTIYIRTSAYIPLQLGRGS